MNQNSQFCRDKMIIENMVSKLKKILRNLFEKPPNENL